MHAGFQKHMWQNGIGDNWFIRNEKSLGTRDMASKALEMEPPTGKKVLEIGCANGWRLKKIEDLYGSEVYGVDPSPKAIEDAKKNGMDCVLGTADKLPYATEMFDVVIFGFCLCFIAPEDWMSVVSESTRVLKEGGILLIYDFIGSRYVKRKLQNVKVNDDPKEYPVYLYHYNWPNLWLAHPGYRIEGDIFDIDHAEVCTILRKVFEPLYSDEIVSA